MMITWTDQLEARGKLLSEEENFPFKVLIYSTCKQNSKYSKLWNKKKFVY